MKVQRMSSLVGDEAMAVSRASSVIVSPTVTVIVSPDPQEIDRHLSSDPLALDPLLVRAEDVKKEVKTERIRDACDTHVKDEIGETYSMKIVKPLTVFVESAESLEEEITPQCLQEKDPLENIPNIPVPKSVLEKTETEVTFKGEEINETSSMNIMNPLTVFVPSAVSLEEEITPQCLQEKNPLENVSNVPLPKSVPLEKESEVTFQVSREITSPLNSCSELSIFLRNEEPVETSALEESVNETSDKQGLYVEDASLGRVTRKSAAVARAKIRQRKWSERDSISSESSSDDADQDYQSSDNESSDESLDDVHIRQKNQLKDDQGRVNQLKDIQQKDDQPKDGLQKDDPQKNNCRKTNQRKVHQQKVNGQEEVWTKDVPDKTASWCSCGFHPPSVLDDVIEELNVTNGRQQNGMSKSKQCRQVSRDNTSKLKSSQELPSVLRNEEHVEASTVGESVIELSDKQGLDIESARPCHVIQKSTTVHQSSDNESSYWSVDSRKEDYNQQKRDCKKGNQHQIAPFCRINSPSLLDCTNTLVHMHCPTTLSHTSMKDQQISLVTLCNEDNPINLQDKCITSKALPSIVSSINSAHERYCKNQTIHRSNSDNVSLRSNNILPVTEYRNNIIPSKSSVPLETLKNDVTRKNLEENSRDPLVKKNNILLERCDLINSRGRINNVSDNCEVSSVVNNDNVDFTMEVEIITNNASVGSKNSLSLTENTLVIPCSPGTKARSPNSQNGNQRKPEKIRSCRENSNSECTKLSQKLTERKTTSDLEANQNGSESDPGKTHRKLGIEDIDERCPKTGRKLTNCPVCGIKVKKCKLPMHSLKHSEHRPHKCKLCPKAFKTNYCLQSHMGHVHDNLFLKCNYCEKQYKSRDLFRRHIKIHKGIELPKAKCDICGKVFEKRRMSKHLESHSMDYKFSCNVCDKKFKTKEVLKTHISHVHNSKPRPRHICEICGRIFKSPSGLTDHMNVHSKTTPYTCDVCGKSFPSRRCLISHMAIHGEKKFKCDICGYSCCRFDNLTTHMRSHTGEKPFKCLICSHAFTRLDNLTTHKRRVHKIK